MEKQGKHRMSREEFIDRMQRDAIRKQTGDAESEQERKEREQREEKERIRKHRAELNAYRAASIERFGHKLHMKDRKARIYGNQ